MGVEGSASVEGLGAPDLMGMVVVTTAAQVRMMNPMRMVGIGLPASGNHEMITIKQTSGIVECHKVAGFESCYELCSNFRPKMCINYFHPRGVPVAEGKVEFGQSPHLRLWLRNILIGSFLFLVGVEIWASHDRISYFHELKDQLDVAVLGILLVTLWRLLSVLSHRRRR